MPTFEELKRRYMVTETQTLTGGGSVMSGETTTRTAIPVYQNSEVTPMINGPEYFRNLKQLINNLGTGAADQQFIYICGWWLDQAFSLDGTAGRARLVDILKQKSRQGVDVRVLGWVMAPELIRNRMLQGSSVGGIQGMLSLNADSMRFINSLRGEASMVTKACLNILSHPAGAVHLKMVIVGNGDEIVGFTGGLDLKPDRHSNLWHDVQARVKGPAVQGLFNTFREMWNEVRGRAVVTLRAAGVSSDTHRHNMPVLAARTISSPSRSRMHVQSLRTLPRYRFASAGIVSVITSLPTNSPLSYAPTGVIEVKNAWQAGINGAQNYIYMEDQAFVSREVFDWINTAVINNPELHVLLVIGQWDPNDAPNNIWTKLLSLAVNNHLLRNLNASQIARIGLFSHRTKTIHTKSTIVDDHWAIIGSANCMRRSLYTDFEHAVAYMDENGRGIQSYRMDLWGIHLGRSFNEPDAAVGEWFSIPFKNSGSPVSSTNFERLPLPLPRAVLSNRERILFDEIYDVDAREEWGDELISLYMSTYGAGALSP